MRLDEVTLYENKSHRILKEGYQDLTEAQKLYQSRFEKELFPLLEQYVKLAEAQLTADQIRDIFNGAEQVAMDSGDNKTLAGKVGSGAAAAAKLPVDIAKKVDAKINELGRMAQNAGPIKNADQKFEDLKKQITANNSDSKIVQGIQKVSDWAKENPGKASLAVGILTAVAAFAGGPVGGAAAGLILRSTKELLQGEKLSSAVGKSIKTAAYGAIAGWALEGIGDWLEGLRVDAIPYDKAPGLTTLEVGFTKTFEVPGFSSVKELGSMIVPEDQVGEFTKLLNAMKDATAGGATTSDPEALNAFNELWSFAKSFDTQEFLADMNLQNEVSKAIAVSNDQFLQNLEMANSAIAAAAQGSIQASGKQTPIKVGGEEIEPTQGELDLSQRGDTPVNKNFNKNQKLSAFGKVGDQAESLSIEERFELYLAEADPAQGELPLDNPNTLGAKMKRGLGKAASAAGGKIKQTAKNVGNKVTADKLMKTWKSMGEPTDSGSIANILQDAGLSNDQIKSIGQISKVALTPDASSEKPGADAQSSAQPSTTKQEPKSAISKGADQASPTAKPIKKGDTKEVNGKTYQWAGALWVDTATNKPVGIANAMNMGLGNPKLDPIIAAAKKDPALAKLIKQQVIAKGVKAGTAQAQKAQKAGVKGTEPVKSKAKTNVKKNIKVTPATKAKVA